MRYALSIAGALLLSITAACGNEREAAEPAAGVEPGASVAPQNTKHSMTAEQLGELGAQIRKDPSRAEALLTEHGLTKETFEAEIRKVSEDPEASKRYADAYRKAGA